VDAAAASTSTEGVESRLLRCVGAGVGKSHGAAWHQCSSSLQQQLQPSPPPFQPTLTTASIKWSPARPLGTASRPSGPRGDMRSSAAAAAPPSPNPAAGAADVVPPSAPTARSLRRFLLGWSPLCGAAAAGAVSSAAARAVAQLRLRPRRAEGGGGGAALSREPLACRQIQGGGGSQPKCLTAAGWSHCKNCHSRRCRSLAAHLLLHPALLSMLRRPGVWEPWR
jgi:hypothetical protein